MGFFWNLILSHLIKEIQVMIKINNIIGMEQ